jgi:hypothetical protein
MSTDTQALLEKLQSLPPQRRAEVEDFVDFLKNRAAAERSAAAERLGEAFKKLDALDEAPMSEAEIQAEIDTVRAERRARADRR